MSCGWVAAHMSGPTTWFGRVLVEGRGPVGESLRSAAFFGFVIAAFWVGAILSAFMTEGAERSGRASKYVLPMAVEATLLGLFAIGLNLYSTQQIQTSSMLYLVTGLACL